MKLAMRDLAVQERYKLLASAVVPRPIAWVTTLSSEGILNAAPYSFFNVMAPDPPLIVLGLMRRDGGARKDTYANIAATREFVVNLVRAADIDAMNATAIDSPAGFDELAHAGIGTAPSTLVKPPRVASAPVSLECVLFKEVEVQDGAAIVLGEVVMFHVDDRFIDDRLHIDTPALDLIARMHGRGWYAQRPELVHRDRPMFSDRGEQT